MPLPSVVVGIDISKHRLDCSAHPAGQSRRFANTNEGIQALAAFVEELAAFCVLEATGIYDAALCQALHDRDIAFHRANPRRTRQFARAAGFLAKTDRIDARMLAAYGASLALAPEMRPDPDRQRLKTLVSRRDQLVDLRKIERTRLAQAGEQWLVQSHEEVIAMLDEQIADLEKAIDGLLAGSKSLAAHRAILCSAPGIGPVTASVLLAFLAELGQRDRRAISALAGLAPLAFESGAMRGRRHLWGGRKRVRDALYMAALAACRSGPFKAIYQAMRDKGKPAKLAIIAIARRLLVALNAAIRDQKPFTA